MPDWGEANNWMALAAILALVLSQLPPLVPRVWGSLRSGTVRISTQDSFALSHHLGRLSVTLHVQIENTGAAPIAVTKIDCVIRRVATGETEPGKTVWRFPARAYHSEPNGNRLFIGTIRLKPDEHWQEVVHCYGSRSQSEEEEAQTIQDKFSVYIGSAIDEKRDAGEEMTKRIEASDELVALAKAFRQKMFDISKGDYELFIAAIGQDGTILGVTKSRFILYENNITTMASIADGYKYGEGVSDLVSVPPYRRFHVEPKLTTLGSDSTVRLEYDAFAKNR